MSLLGIQDRKLIDQTEGFHIVQPNFYRYLHLLTIVSNSPFISVSILRYLDKQAKKRDLLNQEFLCFADLHLSIILVTDQLKAQILVL